MTKIKTTLDQIQTTINNLINKLDIANLGNWNTEKVEINVLLNYLRDKTQPKPAGKDDIQMDLTEIENLETTLQTLTDENTRLTTENATLTTKNSEQNALITGTTIPNLIASLEQYASKVSDSELKTTLANITTALTTLQQNQQEFNSKLEKTNKPANNWTIGACIFGGISVILLTYLAFFKNNKPKDFEINE